MTQYIEFKTITNYRVSLPIGSFGYNEASENETKIFLLEDDAFWTIAESYESFDTRVMELT